jgi:hypothetical protein
VASGNVAPEEAVRAYHAQLDRERLRPLRPLEDDLAITERVLKSSLTAR